MSGQIGNPACQSHQSCKSWIFCVPWHQCAGENHDIRSVGASWTSCICLVRVLYPPNSGILWIPWIPIDGIATETDPDQRLGLRNGSRSTEPWESIESDFWEHWSWGNARDIGLERRESIRATLHSIKSKFQNKGTQNKSIWNKLWNPPQP